jgi:hypothetical protein
MKRRHHRHFESQQKLDDIAAGFATKDSILMLEANNVKARTVQKISGSNVFVDRLVVDLKKHGSGIIVDAPGIRHRHHTGFQIQTIKRNRPMQIVGKGRDAAAARQVIADERNALELVH